MQYIVLVNKQAKATVTKQQQNRGLWLVFVSHGVLGSGSERNESRSIAQRKNGAVREVRKPASPASLLNGTQVPDCDNDVSDRDNNADSTLQLCASQQSNIGEGAIDLGNSTAKITKETLLAHLSTAVPTLAHRRSASVDELAQNSQARLYAVQTVAVSSASVDSEAK